MTKPDTGHMTGSLTDRMKLGERACDRQPLSTAAGSHDDSAIPANPVPV
jgi:hypothetical protein